MKLLETMNAIFDGPIFDEQKRMSALMETAASGHGGQTSALYSLVSTEKVHSEDHRENLFDEIDREIKELKGTEKYEDWQAEEVYSLQALKAFVKEFVI